MVASRMVAGPSTAFMSTAVLRIERSAESVGDRGCPTTEPLAAIFAADPQ
jgi:hypothetical protein